MSVRIRASAFDIKAWRTRMGWSQVEVADHLKVTEREVRRWEREGVRPLAYLTKKMKQLEHLKDFGMPEEPPPSAPPRVYRKLPKVSVGTGRPEVIGIAPSSF